MAVNSPKTFDGPMLIVFEYLSHKDRVSLAQTCSRLRHLAINEGMLGQGERVLSSEASASLARAHRARNLKVTSSAALRAFSSGYSGLAESDKWRIVRLELRVGKASKDVLKEKLGALLPSIASLTMWKSHGSLNLKTPSLVAGLTNCTELKLGVDISDGVSHYDETITVAPAFFAAMPNPRAPSWRFPELWSERSSVAYGPSACPFRPVLGNLTSLTLTFAYDSEAEALISRLLPHVPNLKQLTVEWGDCESIPSAVLELLSLIHI